MDKQLKSDWAEQEWHPSDDELLLYVDGELGRKEAERLRTHLEACWSCRVRSEKIQETISGFIDYRNNVLKPALEPPQGWRMFDAKLGRVVEESGKRSLLTLVRESLEKLFSAPRFAVALASSLCVALLLVALLPRSTTVSADELLQQAAVAEAQQIRAVTQPVVYQKLAVRRISPTPSPDHSATLEIWHDTTNSRVRQTVGGGPQVSGGGEEEVSYPITNPQLQASDTQFVPAVVAELKDVFLTNRLDWQHPLSPTSFQAWRTSLEQKHEEVQESALAGGLKVLTLKTIPKAPVAIGAIVEVDLVVRAEDWHPVSQYLRVRAEEGEREYELTEIAFQVVSLDAIGPFVFAEPPVAPIVPATPASVVSSSPSAAELAAAEMEARSALHDVGADLGEPIEIVRTSSGKVEVRGLAETAERKQELLTALRDIPLVTVAIQTIEEAREAELKAPVASLPSPPEASPAPTAPEPMSAAPTPPPFATEEVVASGRLPIQEELEKYFAARRRSDGSTEAERAGVRLDITEFSNKVLALCEGTLSEAWALRRLAERYSGEELAQFSPQSQWQLENLVRDHIRAMRERIEGAHTLLRPVLRSMAAEEAGGSKQSARPLSHGLLDAGWPAFSPPLFTTVQRIDRLASGLLAGAGLPLKEESNPSGDVRLRAQTPEQAIQTLLADLALLQAEFLRLEERLAGEFLSNPKPE